VLAGVYLLRALGIASLLIMPASTGMMLAFALAMGATHMASWWRAITAWRGWVPCSAL
jgi:hypothetical protein